MPTIELTDEQAEELRDVLVASLKSITVDHRMFDPSNADGIASFHRLSVLNDILELLEVAKRDGGKVAEEVVDRIGDYVQEYAPDLAPIYATLLPFADLFGSTSAGPQKNSEDYDPSEPPYIELHIDDPRYNGSDTDGVQLYCRITADSIVLQWHCVAKSGDYYMDESEIELAALWDYLRQLPRPYDSFCKGGE